jgi:hypothetical protein
MSNAKVNAAIERNEIATNEPPVMCNMGRSFLLKQ